MTKSDDAFRTISEVASELGLATHVLRFWESKFPQIKPLKRTGGRRYYRPDDVALLRRLQTLLHDEGYTIKGVQKLFREEGARKFIDEGSTEAQAPSDPATTQPQASLFDSPTPVKPLAPQDVQVDLGDDQAIMPDIFADDDDADDLVQDLESPSIHYRPDLLPDAPEPEPIYTPGEDAPQAVIKAGLSDSQRQILEDVLADLQEMKKQIDAAA